MQRRDDILGILLPVLVSGLLLLLLVVLRQRRSGKPAFDWLTKWWRERITPVHTHAPREVSPEEEEAFALRAEARAEDAARRDRKIFARDGTTVLLHVGQRLRVETPRALREGTLYDIAEEGLALEGTGLSVNFEVPWDEVRRIDAQHGPPRRRRIQWTFALVGAGLFGACGALFDAIDKSTAGPPSKHSTEIGILLGALLFGFVGTMIMYALPGPRWRPVVAGVEESSPLSLATFADHAVGSRGAPEEAEPTPREEIIARVVVILIVFGTCALFSKL